MDRDEVQCRFCLSALPAWQPVLRGSLDKISPISALPVVAVVFGGQEYRLTVQPTAEGLRRFGRQVEVITGQPFSDAMDVRFFCKSPTGQ
ncbi:hypothetical protein OEZ86_011996 [Tetradesmus obliquus]|uniref:Uncharacterized protein n=1 Tax=Tetradesmus obliquus TaxID=3088 RepID=A0ABY8TJX2_TETOB|nr:hypothetical protein OEZ85_008817 [Tetradesmus obliquus]WIA29495.1 hypothetical protein OEZ86_011996 [Tetradesmus obliquus]